MVELADALRSGRSGLDARGSSSLPSGTKSILQCRGLGALLVGVLSPIVPTAEKLPGNDALYFAFGTSRSNFSRSSVML